MNAEVMKKYEFWCTDSIFDDATKAELKAIEGNETEIFDRFYKDLEFGTGGLRIQTNRPVYAAESGYFSFKFLDLRPGRNPAGTKYLRNPFYFELGNIRRRKLYRHKTPLSDSIYHFTIFYPAFSRFFIVLCFSLFGSPFLSSRFYLLLSPRFPLFICSRFLSCRNFPAFFLFFRRFPFFASPNPLPFSLFPAFRLFLFFSFFP